ncbi:hypothetical protein ACFQ36_13020 [Arthrobacter sp. GCM10027362]|uniref:hypothetical protein n=1 Tax=Arthrobacter sp. GCM10027362 TaxID=3273379 RepID=UPI00362F909B
METNRDSSDDIRLHTEDAAEGDDSGEGIDIRAHSQDSAEGPDDVVWARPGGAARSRRLQEDQPETD